MNNVPKLLSLFILFAFPQGALGAQNVIFMVGDGMGVSHVTAARIYKSQASGHLELDKMPYTALIKTYALDGIVTDSAASATAYASGKKVNNGTIGMDKTAIYKKRDGKNLITLVDLAKKKGKSVGIVTTTRVTHATPAAFYAHTNDRYSTEAECADQLLGENIELIMGGGRKYFEKSKRKDGKDLTTAFQKKGYQIVQNRAELKGIKNTSKVLGLFTDSHMTYMVDRTDETEPVLSEMVESAIDYLSQNPKGYFLLIEGGRIDHAAHDNLARHAFEETIAFDDSLKTVLKKINLQKTLVLVTADHATGGLTINGGTTHDEGLFVASSAEGILPNVPLPILSWASGPSALPDRKKPALPKKDPYQNWQPAQFPSKWSQHTGEDVTLYAKGVGAEKIHGTLENTQVFIVIKESLGL
jgi:alkaline phosphatase